MSERNAQAAGATAGDEQVNAPESGGDEENRSYRAVLDVSHPHVLDVRRELTLEGGTWRYVLVVLTDLSLDPNDPGHDPKDIDSLTQAVMKAARRNRGGYNVLTIRNP